MALYSGTGPALEYQSGVGATEAEAVGHDQVNRLIQTLTQDRQIRCILVQLFDVGRGGEEVVAHHQQAVDRFLYTGGAQGGVGTSAVFLEPFTDYPWAHVDMAGMAMTDSVKERPYLSHGATGYGVRLFLEFLRDWA